MIIENDNEENKDGEGNVKISKEGKKEGKDNFFNDVSSQMSFDVFLSNETQFLIFNSGKNKSNENKNNESNDDYDNKENKDGDSSFSKKGKMEGKDNFLNSNEFWFFSSPMRLIAV